MTPQARDSQRQKFWFAIDPFVGPTHPDQDQRLPYLSPEEVKRQIRRICRSKWWTERFDANEWDAATFTIEDHQGFLTEVRPASGFVDHIEVKLFNPHRQGQWTRLDICRALASICTLQEYGPEVAPHGKEYCKTLLGVVGKWGFREDSTGTEDRKVLAQAFKGHKVKYIWRSVEAREAQRQKRQLQDLLAIRSELLGDEA